MSIERGYVSPEQSSAPGDELIERAKSEIVQMLEARNLDLPVDPEDIRKINTIIEIVEEIGMQKGMAIHPVFSEAPRYRAEDFPNH